MKRCIVGLSILSLLVFWACQSDRAAQQRTTISKQKRLHEIHFEELGLGEPIWGGQKIPDKEVIDLYLLEDSLYAVTSDHEIHAFDSKGHLKWIFTRNKGKLSAAPCVNDCFFCIMSEGMLYVLNKESGGLYMKTALPADPSCDPVASDSTLYYGGWVAESIYTVDLETGSSGWRFRAGESIRAPLVITGDPPLRNLHLASDRTAVYSIPAAKALDAPPTHATWTDMEAGFSTSGMASDANHLYVATSNNGLIAYDRISGQRVWVFFPEGYAASKPTVIGDTVYFKGASVLDEYKRKFFAVNTADGKEKWRVKGGDRVLAKGNQKVFILEEPFKIHVIDDRDGTHLGDSSLDQFEFFMTSEKEGVLYVGNSAGYIYALKAD